MTQPARPDFEDLISVVEELDPEHDGRGAGLRGDLLLGGLLLLAVALFAGWQWWHQDYQTSRYRAGQEAAGRNDLENALYYFSEATGYSNADALAKSAQEQILERDRLYASAVKYADEGEWLPALRDLRDAAKIQPNYMDIAEREGAALRNVYSKALSGTVVLKEGANPPGLYYRTNSGWVWLAGSDARSAVVTPPVGGRIVFDAPDLSLKATATPPGRPMNQIADYYLGRRVVTVQVDDDRLKYAQVPLDPTYFVPTIGGEGGFWAIHYRLTTEANEYSKPPVIETLRAPEITYQPYASVGGVTVKLATTKDVATGSAFMAIDPGRNRYLLAEWTGAERTGVDEDTVINLYMAAAGESDRQLVYTLRGGSIQSAHISPDGRYVVAHAIEEFAWATDSYPATTVTLVEVAEGGRTRVLATGQASSNAYYEAHEKLESVFVQRGVFAGKLLLARHTTGSIKGQTITTIQLIDPAKAMNEGKDDYTLAEGRAQYRGDYYWRVVEQDEDGLLLIGRHDLVAANSSGAFVVFPAGGPAETYSVNISPYDEIQTATATGSHIIWTSRGYEGEGMRLATRSVYSAQRVREGANRPIAQQILTKRDTRYTSDVLSFMPGSINLGDKLMAYTRDGELHARSYDGRVDLRLESGVSAIYEDMAFSYYAGFLR